MSRKMFTRALEAGIVAVALSCSTGVANAAPVAPQATRYNCLAPEGYFNFCRGATVHSGFKLVVYNRTSQNEAINFEARTSRGAVIGRVRLDEGQSGMLFANNDREGWADMEVYTSSMDNDVHVEGTMSVERI